MESVRRDAEPGHLGQNRRAPSMGVFKALRGSPKTLGTLLSSYDRDLAVARRIAGSSGSSSKARIADILLDLADRLGDDDGRRIRLDHWFTHQELADLAGAHRSTVTTALNDWIYRTQYVKRRRTGIFGCNRYSKQFGAKAIYWRPRKFKCCNSNWR